MTLVAASAEPNTVDADTVAAAIRQGIKDDVDIVTRKLRSPFCGNGQKTLPFMVLASDIARDEYPKDFFNGSTHRSKIAVTADSMDEQQFRSILKELSTPLAKLTYVDDVKCCLPGHSRDVPVFVYTIEVHR